MGVRLEPNHFGRGVDRKSSGGHKKPTRAMKEHRTYCIIYGTYGWLFQE